MLPKKNEYGAVKDGVIPPSGEIDIVEVRGHPRSVNDNCFGIHAGDHRISRN
jgi:hypothetical protein